MRGVAFVQLATLQPTEYFTIDGAQDVAGALDAADLVQGLMHAVLTSYEPSRCRIQLRRCGASLNRGDHPDGPDGIGILARQSWTFWVDRLSEGGLASRADLREEWNG